MPRSPARSVTSTVDGPPDTEIPTTRRSRALGQSLRDRSGRRCSGSPSLSACRQDAPASLAERARQVCHLALPRWTRTEAEAPRGEPFRFAPRERVLMILGRRARRSSAAVVLPDALRVPAFAPQAEVCGPAMCTVCRRQDGECKRSLWRACSNSYAAVREPLLPVEHKTAHETKSPSRLVWLTAGSRRSALGL